MSRINTEKRIYKYRALYIQRTTHAGKRLGGIDRERVWKHLAFDIGTHGRWFSESGILRLEIYHKNMYMRRYERKLYPSLKSINTNLKMYRPSVRMEMSGNTKKIPGLLLLSSSWEALATVEPVIFRSGVGSCNGRTAITELAFEGPTDWNDSGRRDGLYTKLQDWLPSSEYKSHCTTMNKISLASLGRSRKLKIVLIRYAIHSVYIHNRF